MCVYDIDIIDRKCNAGERLIDGTCVWWGENAAQFEMLEYTDATYSQEHPEQSSGTRTAGEMIYIGIKQVKVPNNETVTWGVESCWIIEKDTNATHLFFDPTGSTGDLIDNRSPSCSREHLKLEGSYSCIKPEFRFWYRLFMGTRETSSYKLQCKIKLCTHAGNELTNDHYCGLSKQTCGFDDSCDGNPCEAGYEPSDDGSCQEIPLDQIMHSMKKCLKNGQKWPKFKI